MKTVNAIIILAVTLSCPVFAQLKFSGLKLRKTVFDNSKDAEKPANFTMTFPKNKDEFFAANIAIGLGWENDRALITPMFEWHYNNLIDKEQDNVKAGFNLYHLMSGWGLNGAATVNNDRQKNEEKAQLLATVFPVIKGRKLGIVTPNTWYKKDPDKVAEDLTLFWKPGIGLNYDGVYKTEADSLQGSIIRFALFVDFETRFIAVDDQYNLLGIQLNFQYLTDLANSTEADKTEYPLLNLSGYLNLSKDPDATSRLSFDYSRGRDPLTGLAWQQFYAISFRVKI